jgi:hypothetical protein
MSDDNKIVKKTIAFSNLSEKIRFCLCHYLSLGYVCNEVRDGVRKVTLPKQKELEFEVDIFSGSINFLQQNNRDTEIFLGYFQKLSDAYDIGLCLKKG